jgi:hypothetical protein
MADGRRSNEQLRGCSLETATSSGGFEGSERIQRRGMAWLQDRLGLTGFGRILSG